ncbi:WD40/YVTN/BNR-like repeat-containing protein [Algoriphagus chordae]|uniref:Photosynthesis system II assembly factor YCF48-like protein n=1 Tax=Algoriphagus chordae TaxID=237019 RepID=A0A2W7RFH8_9BACT|nr:YCF48-related protein [Algoriphagus chordae]PZX57876.1 photosynthesis system II assembly factor YCF48-like protein [Algoriphagus chordae]
MIKRKLLALSLLIALFSCKNSDEELADKPSGWEILETPVESSLRGLSPLTSEIAWASGSNGVWLRTIDAGKTWDHGVIAGLDSVDFRSIHAFDAMTAIVVSAGQPAVIYKTQDGGQTWELKHQENEFAFLDGISFSSASRGFVVGDPFEGKWTILQTANHGKSWYLVDSLPAAAVGEAAFAASATSLLAEGNELWLGTGGSESNLHYSKDMGASWEKFTSPFIQGESSQGIFSITSMGGGDIVGVGGDYLNEEMQENIAGIYVSNKKEWVLPQSGPGGYRSGVVYFHKQKWLIAVGPSGSDYSLDAGITWQPISEDGFHAVKIGHADGSVWASGAKGKIAKLKY